MQKYASFNAKQSFLFNEFCLAESKVSLASMLLAGSVFTFCFAFSLLYNLL